MPHALKADLSGKVDFDDSLNRGNQVHSFTRISKKRIPSWVNDDAAVQKLLLQVFPKCKTDKRQRESAGRWLRVIQIYFRSNESARFTAEEMKVTVSRVREIVRGIKRAASGLTTRGTERRRFGPGRPFGSKTDKNREIKPKATKTPWTPMTGRERGARFCRRKTLASRIERLRWIIENASKHEGYRIERSLYFTLRTLLADMRVEKSALERKRRNWKNEDAEARWRQVRGSVAALLARLSDGKIC